MRTVAGFYALAMTTLLAACGGPPTESNMRAALEHEIATSIKALEKHQGKEWADRARKEAKVYSVKLGSCTKVGNAYRCAVEVDWATALAPRHQIAMQPLIARTSEGWAVPRERR